METIQLLLESDLLEAANRAVVKIKSDRSTLIRIALREYLAKLEVLERERLDEEGYQRIPVRVEESQDWDEVCAWPEP